MSERPEHGDDDPANGGEKQETTSDKDGRTFCNHCEDWVDPEGDSIAPYKFQIVIRNDRFYGGETSTYIFCSRDCLNEFCETKFNDL